jgi:hypothetical protein
MADLMPVDQVAAVKDRQPGKIFERRSDEIKIIPNPADGWIRVETRQDGITKNSAPLSHWERGGG